MVAWGLSAGAFLCIILTCYRYRTIRRFLLNDLRSSVRDPDLCERLLNWLFLKVDLQAPAQQQYDALKVEARQHFPRDEACFSFFGVLKCFIKKHDYLTDEHLHLAERLRSLIEQEQRRR